MGIPLAYVQELAEYWEKSYDMQRVAERLNRYEQFATTIDGVDIHFLHVRSPVEGATPYVMTHGWPGSVMEFIKEIDLLVDPGSHGGEGRGSGREEATKRRTVGEGVTGPRVGEVAWMVEKFKTGADWGDALESSFTKDELLDNVMVYWGNGGAAPWARLYWHSLASSI